MQNLRNSFPNKTEEELKIICRRYYHYLCDLILETFKTLTVSKKTMIKHCKLMPDALAVFNRYYHENKSVIVVMGHYGNWEWAGNTFSILCKQPLYVIYHPLSNKYFNKLIINMRTRFGTRLIKLKETFRDIVAKKSEINTTAFIADQTPSPDNAYWTTFLSQDTPVFTGTERIATKMNYPIVYVKVKRVKRGYYEIYAETLFENPKETKEGEISEAHTRRLEQDILQQPEIWLWSHRRWKHKKISDFLKQKVIFQSGYPTIKW